MEELVIAVNRLADSSTSLPMWANVVSIVVPILLTLLTIYLTIRIDRQNKKLQIALANRDMQNQTRQAVLDIYNAYCAACNCIGSASENVSSIFVADQSYYQWANDVQKANSELFRAYNQARLLLDDENILNTLKTARDAYSKINSEIGAYIATGLPTQTITNAWSQISIQYGISVGNYYALIQNPICGEAFSKLCETSYTKRIQASIKTYLDIVGCDDFDEPFKKYVQIRELQ